MLNTEMGIDQNGKEQNCRRKIENFKYLMMGAKGGAFGSVCVLQLGFGAGKLSLGVKREEEE